MVVRRDIVVDSSRWALNEAVCSPCTRTSAWVWIIDRFSAATTVCGEDGSISYKNHVKEYEPLLRTIEKILGQQVKG